mmetsp:Transcript_7159/g.8223  ORF Transcript_7159/g.8223 Transcript_7159/m.8223 type:complete len:320 (-) Transcript_7159:945-1904(-)
MDTEELRTLYSGRKVAFVGDESVFFVLEGLYRALTKDSVPTQFSKDEEGEAFLNYHSDEDLAISLSFFPASSIESVNRNVNELEVVYDAIVFGGWVDDANNQMSPDEFRNNLIQLLGRQDVQKTTMIWVQPQAILPILNPDYGSKSAELVAAVEKYHAGLDNEEIAHPNFASVDLYGLTYGRSSESIDGFIYSSRVYAEANQILSNILRNSPLKKIEIPAKRKQVAAKGAGGGVAHNPVYGALVLAAGFIMLFSMDPYYGVSFLLKKACGSSERIDWATSVEKIHKDIGLLNTTEIQESIDAKTSPETEEKEQLISKAA